MSDDMNSLAWDSISFFAVNNLNNLFAYSMSSITLISMPQTYDQEEMNRQFIAAIATLEAATDQLRGEVREAKDDIRGVVTELGGIKKLFFFLVLGIVANINPQHWIELLSHVIH